MKHPVLACRLRTSARAPGCALRPKALHHVHTHAHAHSHKYTHSCAQANRRFRTSETVQFSFTFLTSPVPAPVPPPTMAAPPPPAEPPLPEYYTQPTKKENAEANSVTVPMAPPSQEGATNIADL
jgi:hypothetical protein